MSELNAKTILVSSGGGLLDYVDDRTGEVLFTIAVPPGKYRASQYLELVPESAHVEIAEGLVAIQPKGMAARQVPDNLTDTGANPDFQPTSADRLQRQMQRNLAVLAANQKSLDARLRAFNAVERVPDNPAPAQPPSKPEGEAELVE